MSVRPVAAGILTLVAACLPVSAAARPAAAPPSAACGSLTACDALSDAELSAVYGTGTPRTAFLRTAARDNSEAFYRFSAQTLPVTFDNWFNDVGTPLIVANLSR